ncbi:MAG: GTP-binding protein, partial [Bacteroidota bacterium]
VFLENPAVEKAYKLQQVICLVDANQVEDWLKEAEEALRQIAVADVLLINKIDTVSESKLEDVRTLLKGINPQASVFQGTQGVFPMQEIMSIGTVNPASVEQQVYKHHHHEHTHQNGNGSNHKITTFTLNFTQPLDLDNLQIDLNKIVHLYRDQVYRVKGFIAIPNYSNRVILQSARSTFIATDGTPWEDQENREGKLVFIGRGLKKEAFEKMFNQYLLV